MWNVVSTRMKRTVHTLLLSMLLAVVSPAQDRLIRFSGEVSQGREFRKEIGAGLVFVLAPSAIDPGAIGGWTITVSPQGKHPAECNDFVWVVTPPYRSYNARYLDTSYGTTAKDAVSISPREFRFVLNCEDYGIETGWVGRVLWPYAYSEAQVKEAMAKLGSSPLGKGRLWVQDSRISPAPKTAGGKNLGQIDWVKFEVEIQVPSPRSKK